MKLKTLRRLWVSSAVVIGLTVYGLGWALSSGPAPEPTIADGAVAPVRLTDGTLLDLHFYAGPNGQYRVQAALERNRLLEWLLTPLSPATPAGRLIEDGRSFDVLPPVKPAHPETTPTKEIGLGPPPDRQTMESRQPQPRGVVGGREPLVLCGSPIVSVDSSVRSREAPAPSFFFASEPKAFFAPAPATPLVPTVAVPKVLDPVPPPAPLEIVGPSQVNPYKLVELTVPGDWEGVLWDYAATLDARVGDKSILFVGPPASYEVRAIGVNFTLKRIGQAKKTVTIGTPNPDPNPNPNPDPNPKPVGPMLVIIFQETTARTAEFASMVYAKATDDYLTSKGHKKWVPDPHGTPIPPELAEAFKRAAGKTLPYLVLTSLDGKTVYAEQTVPNAWTSADLINAVKAKEKTPLPYPPKPAVKQAALPVPASDSCPGGSCSDSGGRLFFRRGR